MIQFRYGKRDAVAAVSAAAHAAVASVLAAASAAKAATSASLLPARFQPRFVAEDEIECLRLGGAVLPIGVVENKATGKKKPADE